MKDEMPLTDRDFAAIRASVMQTIETRRSRQVWMIRAVAVIAIVAALHWPKTPTKTARTIAQPIPSCCGPDILVWPARQECLAHTDGPPATVIASVPQTRPRRHHRWTKHHQPVVAVKRESAPVRLELATEDPDIRIIWITNTNESTGETR